MLNKNDSFVNSKSFCVFRINNSKFFFFFDFEKIEFVNIRNDEIKTTKIVFDINHTHDSFEWKTRHHWLIDFLKFKNSMCWNINLMIKILMLKNWNIRCFRCWQLKKIDMKFNRICMFKSFELLLNSEIFNKKFFHDLSCEWYLCFSYVFHFIVKLKHFATLIKKNTTTQLNCHRNVHWYYDVQITTTNLKIMKNKNARWCFSNIF